jgi:hypothetical protein
MRLKRRRRELTPFTVELLGSSTAGDDVTGQWREGFRLDPNARWDDEIQRLSKAANADVVFQLVDRDKRVHVCATECPAPATRTVTVSTPDKKASLSVDLCEDHYQAARNDRSNAKQGLDVSREFVDKSLGGNPEAIGRIEPVITSPELSWKTVDLPDRVQEPPRRDVPEQG